MLACCHAPSHGVVFGWGNGGGYHVYKDTWGTVVGKELPCQDEDGSRPDSFAVAVVRGEAIVGHVLKKTSVCSLYLMLGWLDHLSSNKIQTLLWGFSARPPLLLSVSNCSVLLVLESKFCMEKISWSFMRNMGNFALYENFPLYGTCVCVHSLFALGLNLVHYVYHVYKYMYPWKRIHTTEMEVRLLIQFLEHSGFNLCQYHRIRLSGTHLLFSAHCLLGARMLSSWQNLSRPSIRRVLL